MLALDGVTVSAKSGLHCAMLCPKGMRGVTALT